MANRFSISFADSMKVLADGILIGLSQLALQRGRLVGTVLAGCIGVFSLPALGMALWGGLVATAWPVWRQRDVRLVNTGWYGVNGALCGMWAQWMLPNASEAAILGGVMALAAAVVLDVIAVPLGDAPVRLPPLTIPLIVVAGLAKVMLPSLQDGYEAAWRVAPEPPEAEAAAAPDVGAAWAEYKRGHYGNAERLFRQALRHDGGDVWALDGLGWIAYDRGLYGEARVRFGQAVERDPRLADALTGLGWSSLMLRQPGAAVRQFESALAHDRMATTAREGLGYALLGVGRIADAEAAFLDLLPRHAGAVHGLADARRALAARGEPGAAGPLEARALADALGMKALVVPVIVAAVLLSAPWAGFVGMVLAGASVACMWMVAGPASFLWIDLHIQTIALTGILVAHGGAPSVRNFIAALLTAGAAGMVWAISHRLGMWLPLLSFNVVGLGYLAGRRLTAELSSCRKLPEYPTP